MTSTSVQDDDNSSERLRAFMKIHNLSLEDLAKLLRTPPATLQDWLQDGLAPPASMLALMILLQSAPQAWCLFGIENGSGKSAGAARAPIADRALKRVRAL